MFGNSSIQDQYLARLKVKAVVVLVGIRWASFQMLLLPIQNQRSLKLEGILV
jgi:hypothetical protein